MLQKIIYLLGWYDPLKIDVVNFRRNKLCIKYFTITKAYMMNPTRNEMYAYIEILLGIKSLTTFIALFLIIISC